MSSEKLTFEQKITRLDEIVSALEKGDATLDEALTLFEEGSSLIKDCNEMLSSAEQKVVLLKKGIDGEPIELPFEGAE